MKTAAELAKEHGASIDDVVALAAEIEKYARIQERGRIAAIVEFGLEHDLLCDALVLAFRSELSPTDAVEIMSAKQSADVIRAH